MKMHKYEKTRGLLIVELFANVKHFCFLKLNLYPCVLKCNVLSPEFHSNHILYLLNETKDEKVLKSLFPLVAFQNYDIISVRNLF